MWWLVGFYVFDMSSGSPVCFVLAAYGTSPVVVFVVVGGLCVVFVVVMLGVGFAHGYVRYDGVLIYDVSIVSWVEMVPLASVKPL